MPPPLRVAACHAAPVFLSAERTTEKAIGLIHRAAANGARLVVFPESFIPAFPIWAGLKALPQRHALGLRLNLEALHTHSLHIKAIREAAATTGTMVSIGCTEQSRGQLYSSNLVFSPLGAPVLRHRKQVLFRAERTVWTSSISRGLSVCKLKPHVPDAELVEREQQQQQQQQQQKKPSPTVFFGHQIGALPSSDNMHPPARYALAVKGEHVHISTWPPIWPTHPWPTRTASGNRTPDSSCSRIHAAGRMGAVRQHCIQAGCFGVVCAGYLGADAVDAVADVVHPSVSSDVRHFLETAPRVATMFLDPTGERVEDAYTIDPDSFAKRTTAQLQEAEDILYADLDSAAYRQ